MDVLKRQEQLDLKEKELNAKEAELKRQQEQMIADGTLKPKKNWPKCYPVTRHDIDGEVGLLWSFSPLKPCACYWDEYALKNLEGQSAVARL